ncbi:MAG: hypothetical protein JJ953_07405 [Gracilimonas sp.]|uniref:hypothetical protein n=1 Tax=Gracilimonas TaxID=649462 RepID=UPI001B0DE4BC|nr:hypothetical protein [Gracilimonas sp.]MBO6585910.1 hypothetical protein [Gracilimonas sp.]MBO6616907.1 hypothetical protein [Gracilimonas sp.]
MGSVHGQTPVDQQKLLQSFDPDSSYFLGEWVIPSSINITADGTELSSEKWTFDEQSGLLSFRENNLPDYRQVVVRYQEFPFTISRTYQPRKPIELDSTLFADPDSLEEEIASRQRQPGLAESNLRQSGSLSRGIIVGSNQDFALESGLNFELSGALTENININASLTDQSIPIQPDGTTQNLREFDKVFIQVEAPNTTVEMGDVDISLEQSTFARLNRRLQGATGYVNSDYGDYTGAASVVRGTYKPMSFSGQDGFQGPYRLTGRNDQEFVIILAGTERVYVNGQQVQRGAEHDYIIDYGLGEVTFTNNLLIKDETRIVIEYEYVDQDFNRTMVAAEGGGDFLDGRMKVGASVIRQADGDDLLSQQVLTQSDIELLQDVGDDLGDAVVNGARIATEDERDRFVMYAEIDTVLEGQSYTIYQNQPGSEDAIYRVQFTNVGEGEGSYRRVSSQVNGLLYEWVGPGLGSYEPFRQLPAPQKQQMAAIYGSFNVSDNIQLFGEWAASDFDANRFSSLDDANNTDMAYESGLRISEANSAIGKINASVSRRYSGRRFQFFERTRDVEFDRKWNITRTGESKEVINQASLSVSPTGQTTIGGELGIVERDRFYGVRQASFISSSEEGIMDVSYRQDWVKSEDEVLNQNGNWFRHNGSLSKGFDAGSTLITPYVSFEQENREQRNAQTDSLTQLSRNFYDVGPGLRVTFSDLELDASVAYREEEGVIDNRLQDEARAIEQRYRVSYRPGSNFGTTNEVRLRDKQFTEAFEAEGGRNRQGLLIKSVTNYSTNNELLDGEFFYEANTQRRALLQETYIEVGPEIGQYVWDDLNGDGTQQVDEFFLEVSPNEGTFIRQFLPSDELLPVIDLNARLLNTIQPLVFLEEGSWLREIRLRSRIDITENSTTRDLADVYLLKLSSFRNDSNTVQGRLLWEKELNLLNGVNRADLRLGYSQNRSLNQRSTESIESYTDLTYLNTALDITDRIRISLDALGSTNRSESSRLQNRNYDIRTLSFKPGINGTINRSWNAGLEISYARKEDRFPEENVTADLLKVSTTHRTFLWRKLQSNLRLELRNTTVNGSSSSYGNYELTEGTGEGTNLIWSLNSTYRASNLIRISFNYDGRTVSDRAAIHTIKLVMSATF